jgi:hypothetical protein
VKRESWYPSVNQVLWWPWRMQAAATITSHIPRKYLMWCGEFEFRIDSALASSATFGPRAVQRNIETGPSVLDQSEETGPVSFE